MAMNSINTNTGAMVALQSLNRTNDALAVTQKRISTGQRVSDAKDDGAAFAVAQSVRADVAGLSSANEQMGGVKGILDTTTTALTSISNTMAKVNETLVKLADGNLTADQRTQYNSAYTNLVTQMTNVLADATYNGKTLVKSGATAADDIATVRNESGTTYNVAATDSATLLISSTPPADAAAAQGLLTGTTATDFKGIMGAINSALNKYGNDSNYLDAQVSYNKSKMDSLNSGIGALVDADLAKESATLQSLQIRQQLGTQALSIANSAPQTLLSLFR